MKKTKIAAIGDIHMQKNTAGMYKELLGEISEKADILVLAGDLTDHGYPDEAELLAQELSVCKIPVIGVLGNHDYTSNQEQEIKKILSPKAMHMLDEEPYIHNGIGFVGVKGFGGGFGQHMLGMFGEVTMRQFVYEALNESLKLENLLSKLENVEKKVVVLHYSPIRETVIGENEEIFPFLGSSRISEPVEFFNVSLVLHGHAHFGSAVGKTLKGIPVHNVSYLVQKKLHDKEPYALIEI